MSSDDLKKLLEGVNLGELPSVTWDDEKFEKFYDSELYGRMSAEWMVVPIEKHSKTVQILWSLAVDALTAQNREEFIPLLGKTLGLELNVLFMCGYFAHKEGLPISE